MDSIEAQMVKTVPGHLLMMRWAEEETANQCSNTKESTGAPVSASEQDSHIPQPSRAHLFFVFVRGPYYECDKRRLLGSYL